MQDSSNAKKDDKVNKGFKMLAQVENTKKANKLLEKENEKKDNKSIQHCYLNFYIGLNSL